VVVKSADCLSVSPVQYYPPDFDPAKLPRGQRGNKDAQMKVSRTALPFAQLSLECSSCSCTVNQAPCAWLCMLVYTVCTNSVCLLREEDSTSLCSR